MFLPANMPDEVDEAIERVERYLDRHDESANSRDHIHGYGGRDRVTTLYASDIRKITKRAQERRQ